MWIPYVYSKQVSADYVQKYKIFVNWLFALR